MPTIQLLFLGLLCLLAPAMSLATPPERVVSLGGTVTEIIYELGLEHALVGTDLSSIYPQAATSLPSVGYYRSLSIEGLIALQPDKVLASEQAGPAHVLERIRALGIEVEIIDDQASLGSLNRRISQIATIFDVPDKGRNLQENIRKQIPTVELSAKPVNALVLMSHDNQMRAAGANTVPDLLLQLAGMHNVLDQQEGYRNISGEAVAALAPDAIILTGSTATSPNSGMLLTPAARHNNIVTIDPLLMLGIGPRIGTSLALLGQLRNKALHHPDS